MLPLALIGLARLFATDMPKLENLEVARAVLEEYVRRNPPNRTWKMTASRVTAEGKLEMDVDVDNYDEAQFILSRSGRIRYNYLKLSCPVESADVYGMLPQGDTIWIKLHYNNEPIVDGPCPLSSVKAP